MSSLQITFILLGVIIVLIVIAYNAWYMVRHSPRKAKPFTSTAESESAESTHHDRLEPALDTSPVSRANNTHSQLMEPSLDGSHPEGHAFPDAAAHSTAAAGYVDNTQAAASSSTEQPHRQESHPQQTAAPAAVGQQPAAGLALQEFDSLVFSIVQLDIDKPVSGDLALAHMPPTKRIGTKQFLIQGLNLQTKTWEVPRPASKYSEFQAAIQLANRQGALNEIEFSEFIMKTQEFADAIGAAPDFPDMLHEVARGREVDAFAAQNDAVLNLMLVARRATWSPGYVRQMAAQYGFKPSVTPGRLVLSAAHTASPPVLVLSYDPQAAMADDLDHAPIHEILLTLDVPNVDRAENAFTRLRQIMEELAESMEGIISDPEGRKLPTMAMDSIGADVEKLYDTLDARGFPAGSPSTLKLFS